jgi:dihydropyrimidinase
MRAGDFVIAGGEIVTPSGQVEGDLVVRDGRIAEIAPGRGGRAGSFDARGCVVIPGGVDPHAHALTDIGAASRAAAHGGTTTILTFTLPTEGEPPEQAFRRARDTLVAKSAVDTGIHASYFDPEAVSVRLLEALRADGVCGLQVFLAFPDLGLMFDDGRLYEMLRDATARGLPVQVQCENGALVDALTRELVAAGKTAARFYPRSRPAAVESEAVARTLAIAALAGAPVYLVHLSVASALAMTRTARANGASVTVEACTHHLILDEGAYDRPDAHRFIVGPPLRPRDDVDALWEAISDGTVATVGSDHAHLAPDPPTPATPFVDMPMGLPGIELRVPLVLSEGLRRDIPLGTLTDVLAAGPARAFGIYPRKGALAPGADADVVVWDPSARTVVRGADLHDGVGHSPYEGRRIDGGVRLTVSGGRVLVRDGEFVGEPDGGRFIAPIRTPPAAAGATTARA